MCVYELLFVRGNSFIIPFLVYFLSSPYTTVLILVSSGVLLTVVFNLFIQPFISVAMWLYV